MSNQQAGRQAASFTARKNRRSRQFISGLPQWSAGLSVTKGQLYQYAGVAWSANADGTTGVTPPTVGSTDTVSDGDVSWTRVWRLLVA